MFEAVIGATIFAGVVIWGLVTFFNEIQSMKRRYRKR